MKDFTEITRAQRNFFETGQTRSLSFRISALRRLQEWVLRHEAEICQALNDDLGKAPFESWATEIAVVMDELKEVKHHLSEWISPVRVSSNLKNWPSYGLRIPEPYGLVLIMAPWNYPFQLTIDPLVEAIAAGNCVLLKPASYSEMTSHLIARMCGEIFEPEHVTVVEGGREENAALLDQAFDRIFFTGSPTVGKAVMTAAAKFLTPVTLELGGKSPCIVDETANLKLAAKRIVWGKFLNAGQTCVAPDYILVKESMKEKLVDYLKKDIRKFYGNSLNNPDYPKIINEKHFKRLSALMENEEIISGGAGNSLSRKIEPTILDHISWESPVMQEEIFGPILPIMTYESSDEVVKEIKSRPKPLAAYIFTKSKANARFLLKHLSFGGGCINDVVVHVSVTNLPFGGVGNSGMGSYHGKQGFDTFSHTKSLLIKSRHIDIPLRYPPYKKIWLKLVKRL